MKQFEEHRKTFSTASLDVKLDLPRPLHEMNVEGMVADGELTVPR